MDKKIGIIGGTGLADTPLVQEEKTKEVDTPFGKPSSPIIIGNMEDKKIAFLGRHGPKHSYSPTTVPYRANLYAMKKLGVEKIISICAVGSMKKEITPKHMVIPDQYFDFTKKRKDSFFHQNMVVHVSMAEPFCNNMSKQLKNYLENKEIKYKIGGTYLGIEGPQFSTKAESKIFKNWGIDIIGMTATTEAKLSREIGICYQPIANVTDFDVWYEGEENVDMEMIKQNVKKSQEEIIEMLKETIPEINLEKDCKCDADLSEAVATQVDESEIKRKSKLEIIKEKSQVLTKYRK